MSRQLVFSSAKRHGYSDSAARRIAAIIAPARAAAEIAATGLRAGDHVVCEVWHSTHSRRIGVVTAEGRLSFGGGILHGARIERLSRPYRFSRSPDWRTVVWDGCDVCTLADGTTFRLTPPAGGGQAEWTDSTGTRVQIADEAVRLTPAAF